MHHSLSPFIHYALFGSRAVVLDTRRDRYSLMGPLSARALADLSIGADPPASVAAKLVDVGILQIGDGRRASATVPTPRISALEADSSAVASSMSVGRLAATIVFTMLQLKSRGLQSSLQALEKQRARQRLMMVADDRLVAIARAYDRARAWLPIPRICLRDAICLDRLLIDHGVGATLVIGVRLDPFLAHAWVQADDVLLSDKRDAITPFKPILAL